MTEEYKYIILPPDGFHMTMRDTIADAREYIPAALEVIEKIRQPGESVLIKYRTENQRRLFPTRVHARVGYGNLLDLCGPDTVVVGRPGSATWECLLNDISFYAFWDMWSYCNNRFTNRGALTRLSNILKVARTPQELHSNLSHGEIYQAGRSKLDLLHSTGVGLPDIVSAVLADRGHQHA